MLTVPTCVRLHVRPPDATALDICLGRLFQVAIGRWRSKGMPSFAEYNQQRQSLWQQPKWARGVLVMLMLSWLICHI